MKKKTKLTIETERVFVIRRGGTERRAGCGVCEETVRLLTADEAARLARVSARAIYRMVEGGKIHFTETGEGLLLVCFNSLRCSLLETYAQNLTNNLDWEGDNHESEQ